MRRIPVGPPATKPFNRDRQIMRFGDRWHTVREVGDLVPCSCNVPTAPGVVLDPFMGAGTTGLVAEQLHRDWIGVEINPEYRDLAMKRIGDVR